MSNIVYSNVPPMMEAIRNGDIDKLKSLLHAGYSPNELQHYQVNFDDWPRDEEASPLELAVLEKRMDMVQLLIEFGADLTYKPEELLYGSLRSQDLNLFSFLTDAGARIPAEQRDICRLFLHLADRHDPDVLPILDRLNMDLKQYGGEALRSMASHGNQLLAEYLVQKGTDINYHKPDMVFPYASTPVTEAARHNDFSMVRWLVEHGADITIPDKYGDRPYTVAVQNKNLEMAAYLKALEPEDWHNEQEKVRQLKPYKLPSNLVEYLKTGPLRLEFPERELVKWAELYSFMDVQEMTWKRKKLLSLMVQMDNYHQHTAQWNKHMVKRILENERYLGMDGYPQLVTDEEFLAVRLRRGEQNTYAPCPSEIIPIRDKAVCALCGEKMARDTKSRGRPRWRCKNPECGGSVYLDDSIILERVVQKLKVLAHSPECIRLPKAAPASTDALRIENELALCFNRADINPEYMKTLIMAAAAERYAGLNDPTPAHRRALLRQKLELEPENEETLWELFESAVTHVCIGKGGEISLSQKDQKECAS